MPLVRVHFGDTHLDLHPVDADGVDQVLERLTDPGTPGWYEVEGTVIRTLVQTTNITHITIDQEKFDG